VASYSAIQAMHCTRGSSAEEPSHGGAAAHAVAFGADSWPAGQLRQAAEPVCAWYLLPGHTVHAPGAPGGPNWPAAQSKQAALGAVAKLNWPSLHDRHEVCPAYAWNLPGGHAAHAPRLPVVLLRPATRREFTSQLQGRGACRRSSSRRRRSWR
jgi:hypothetical protein